MLIYFLLLLLLLLLLLFAFAFAFALSMFARLIKPCSWALMGVVANARISECVRGGTVRPVNRFLRGLYGRFAFLPKSMILVGRAILGDCILALLLLLRLRLLLLRSRLGI